MRRRIALEIGSRWGKWTVVGLRLGPGPTKYLCRCECGRERVIASSALRRGDTASCPSCKSKRHGETSRRNGMTPEWRAWQSMHRRCDPGTRDAKNYFDRGISVCEEWTGEGGYERFLAHVGRRPSPGHSLDRIDNDRGYEPGNVRWATWQQQHRNRRGNRMVEVDGESLCIAEWSERSGVDRRTILARLNAGWDAKRAVFEPVHRKRRC